MTPIKKLKSRTLTHAQRNWLRWQLWHLGWFETVRVVKSSKRYTPNHHVVGNVERIKSDIAGSQGLVY